MNLGTAALYSVLGLCVVFFALVLLMLMTKIMTRIIPAETPAKAAAKVQPQEKASPELAPGTAGEIKLNGVDERTAAMCMAIIADELKKPLNELRFISIKEVND